MQFLINFLNIILLLTLANAFKNEQYYATATSYAPAPQNQIKITDVQENARAPRSFLGGFEPILPPVSYGSHISKGELASLLDAWKDVEQADNNRVASVTPEPRPMTAPAAPPRPLTVSLPAFVPIQLSAMYTAPAPSASTAPATPEEENEPEQKISAEEEASADPPASLPEPETTSKDTNDALLQLLATALLSRRPVSSSSKNLVEKEIIQYSKPLSRTKRPVKRTKYISSYEPATRIYTPPPFFKSAPVHFELVPSSHLLSNWS